MSKARLLRVGIPALLLLLMTMIAGVVLAQGTSGAAIDWQVLSSGGAPAVSSSGNFTLNGTLGQTAIGPSSQDQTTLWAGFWYTVKRAWDLFLPFIRFGF
jgi:hypothetical protein